MLNGFLIIFIFIKYLFKSAFGILNLIVYGGYPIKTTFDLRDLSQPPHSLSRYQLNNNNILLSLKVFLWSNNVEFNKIL